MDAKNTNANKVAEKLISDYAFEVHPEGGCFSEVYTSAALLNNEDNRPAGGSIYFLLSPGAISHYHQIDCEEIWYYHSGCGMKIYMISHDGKTSIKKLGLNTAEGEQPMVIIPQGTIFAAENIKDMGYTFVSCATFPKFSYSGFKLVAYDEIKGLGVEQRLCIK